MSNIRGTRLRWRRTYAAAAAAMAVVLGLPGQSMAAPSVSEIEKQIDAAWNKLEPLVEQYNMVHGQLTANRKKADQTARRLAPLQLQVDVGTAQLGDVAATMYMGGPAQQVTALLTAGSPQAFADRLSILNLLAADQRAQIATIVMQRDRYAADKARLDDLVASLKEQDAALAANKKTIEAQITSLQKLRQQAYGSSGATGKLKPVACPVDYLGGPGGTAAKKACSLIGKPYIWAAAGPTGYDCSGLTLTAWKAAGVTLRHYTKWQWADTTKISRSELRPGDLVFFFSDLHHMGLYVGGGWMVHAPSTGDYVRMAKIDSPYLPIAGFRRP